MTPPPENRFGRAGGPSMAQIKEYSTLETSSTINLTEGGTILGDASSLPGGSASSYYLLWGLTATTNVADPFLGLVYDSGVAHTNTTTDASTYLGFGANNQGPFFWNTEQPVKIRDGSGLKLDVIYATNNTLLTVIYSVVHAGV
tara:strand:- start:1484 stop:1915 length:432 start_codon:yes stop_codon:yes gene_type:complete